MSANNFLHIRKTKKGTFIIENVDVDTSARWKVDEVDTFKLARKRAEKVISEYEIPVEYGVEYDESCFED
jgi:hypothetical protein